MCFDAGVISLWLPFAFAGAWYGEKVGVNPVLAGIAIATAGVAKLFLFVACMKQDDSSSNVELTKKVTILMSTDTLINLALYAFNLTGKKGTIALCWFSAILITISVRNQI